MDLDIRNPRNQPELGQGHDTPPTERQPHSCHIPVPRNRKPSGHADKEVMAATVLTSLSTSPMVLQPSSAPTEPAARGWKEVLSASYSSSTSGNWSWDNSDQSVPSTPSPPLSNENSKNFLLSSNSDDISEDIHESTHFMFDDPIPRKRKNSMKVMFKCLWKNCEKVLSTSSGIQRHIRTVHLGRNSDSDYSDGEEDFYYSEIEVNMDSLTEGLSSLTPTSPTTVAPPPVFPSPLFDVPHSAHINVNGSQSHAPTLLSQSAPSTLCHIRTDHAYQGPVNPVRTVTTVERRLPAPSTHAAVTKTHALVTPATKATPGTRKPRGDAKKCRKVYGMEKKDMWCTACRWKKACQRFTD
uniref:Si:rp71-79p20.2 n=1 Tax=Neogobius melanostomus TaxID=47308 RepID=A0A8C6T0L5_9GOBI